MVRDLKKLFSLENKVVVITGAAGLLGRKHAEAVAAYRGHPILLDLGQKALDAQAKELSERFKVKAAGFAVDITDESQIETNANLLIERYGQIDGLVNNAGLSISHSIEETDIGDFDRLVPLNLIGPMLCTKHSVASMKDVGWGRIVNITSRGALGKEKRSAYAATKGGLAAMTRVWALELAEFGITANNIGPGPIATELFRAVNPDDSPATQQIIESVPVKRLGTPEDVATAVMFFLDRNSGFITGQTLYVCGGLTVGLSEA